MTLFQKFKTLTTSISVQDMTWVSPDYFELAPITRAYTEVVKPIVSIESVSVSTPGYYVMTQVVVPAKVPKRTLTEPQLPHRRKTLLIGYPQQRPKQSKRSYNQVLHRYRLRRERAERINDTNRRLYEAAMQKYDRRKNHYDSQQIRLKHGRLKKVKTRNVKVGLIENPHTRVVTHLEPLSGSFVQYESFSNSGHPIVRYNAKDGYLGDIKPDAFDYSGVTSVIEELTTAADNRAQSRIQKALNGESVHLANLVAERAQSYSMLADSLKRLLKYVVRFSWKNIGKDALEYLNVKKSKTLANDTLAFLFGAKPLMADVYAIGTLLHKESKSQGDMVIVREGAKRERSYKATYGRYSYDVFVQVKIRYVQKYRISSPEAYELQNLGLVNPLEVLYEKMPWSFVIDWLYPLGTWIRGMSNTVGLSYIGGTKSVTVKTVVSVSADFYEPTYTWWGGEGWNAGLARGSKIQVSKVRSVLSSPLSNNLPAFKNPISITHIIETLALFRQSLKR